MMLRRLQRPALIAIAALAFPFLLAALIIAAISQPFAFICDWLRDRADAAYKAKLLRDAKHLINTDAKPPTAGDLVRSYSYPPGELFVELNTNSTPRECGEAKCGYKAWIIVPFKRDEETLEHRGLCRWHWLLAWERLKPEKEKAT